MLATMPDRRGQTLERELLEFAPDAVVGVDEHGEIRLVNSLTEAVFGYERGELIGQPVEMLVPSGLRTGHVSHRDLYFESPRTRPMGAGLDLYARRKDGTEFPCEISLSTVATEAGVVALAAIRDITDRRRDRDDMRRAVKRLQAATEVAIAVGARPISSACSKRSWSAAGRWSRPERWSSCSGRVMSSWSPRPRRSPEGSTRRSATSSSTSRRPRRSYSWARSPARTLG